MKDIRYEDIKELVRGYYAQNKSSASYMELIAILKISRKHKAYLKRALEELTRDGILQCKKRRYSPPPQTKKKSRPEPGLAKLSPGLIEGIFDATSLAKDLSYAFVRTAKGDFFIDADNTLNAFHNDKVAIEISRKRGGGGHAVVRRILSRANATMAGDIFFGNRGNFFISQNPKIHKWFTVNDIGKAKQGDKVIFEVTNWGAPLNGILPGGKVTEVLGPSGDPQVELIGVIRQYDLPLQFPDEVVKEVSALSDIITEKEIAQREDLRELFTFTIDPASAKDFDDAISIKKDQNFFHLWVHIADVAAYVSPGSQTFEEAAKRGNSFYFPKKVIPMLPERLSNLICSLRPDEDKLCLTVYTRFDHKGRIKAQKLSESVIRSDHRLSYEQVDELFEEGKSELEQGLQDALLSGRQLSRLLSKKRLSEGYIFFDLPEIEYDYDDDGFVKKLSLSSETESHKLIENFMLVANEYIAERLSLLSPTSIYRIHEDPDERKLQRLATLVSHYGLSFIKSENLNLSLQYLLNSMPSEDHHIVFDRMILRSMKKAKYSTEHLKHFGLGIQNYTHFTSPIRRLCDLVIHQLCKSYLLKSSKIQFGKKQLSLYAETASNQELLADEAERDIERIYSLAYMKKRIGDEFTGLVIATKSSALIVRLNEIPITGLIKIESLKGGPFSYQEEAMRFVSYRTKKTYQLMDKVKVKIEDVSDDIYMVLDDGKAKKGS